MLIGENASKAMLAGIPDAREVVLPRTGHMFRFSHPVRRTDAADRRYLQLSLTPEGERLATAVAGIEEFLYAAMDAACDGLDIDATLTFLHNFIDPLPSGEALNKRLALD